MQTHAARRRSKCIFVHTNTSDVPVLPQHLFHRQLKHSVGTKDDFLSHRWFDFLPFAVWKSFAYIGGQQKKQCSIRVGIGFDSHRHSATGLVPTVHNVIAVAAVAVMMSAACNQSPNPRDPSGTTSVADVGSFEPFWYFSKSTMCEVVGCSVL